MNKNRRTETAVVKQLLSNFDYRQISVRHGRGTVYGHLFIKVTIYPPDSCLCLPDPLGRLGRCCFCLMSRQQSYKHIASVIMDYTGQTAKQVSIAITVEGRGGGKHHD